MNFLCDEGVERHIVEALREAGHQVAYVAEIDPSISDAEVLRRAADSEAVLITSDKDFGGLVYRQGRAHAGIVLVRLHAAEGGAPSQLAQDDRVARDLAFLLPSAVCWSSEAVLTGARSEAPSTLGASS